MTAAINRAVPPPIKSLCTAASKVTRAIGAWRESVAIWSRGTVGKSEAGPSRG